VSDVTHVLLDAREDLAKEGSCQAPEEVFSIGSGHATRGDCFGVKGSGGKLQND
jgi:hypothetical protein